MKNEVRQKKLSDGTMPMPNFFRFTPLYKERIWGGTRLLPFKGKPLTDENIGETWEVSAIPGDETRVQGGSCDGLRLDELIARYGEALTGRVTVASEGPFPLLVKFIDTMQDLSIQVHPDDATARRQGKLCGKTEMWYIVDAAPGTTLQVGFNGDMRADNYEQVVVDSTISRYLRHYPVKKGDCFCIPAGQVHSIGAGILLIEIQQAGDTTYRIFDYNRIGHDGKPRPLHTREAREAIDFAHSVDCPTVYAFRPNERIELASCPYYTTARYDIDRPLVLDYHERPSFTLLIAYEGTARLRVGEDTTVLRASETILLPATTEKVEIEPFEKSADGYFRFLETFV